MYFKLCDLLGVIFVFWFGNEIGYEEIKINYCFLKEMGIKVIVFVFLGNKIIFKLYVVFNELNIKGGIYMGKFLLKNRVFIELNLVNNNIKWEGIVVIVEVLLSNMVIRKLDLFGNGFGEKDVVLLVEGIENNSFLYCLNLSYNKFFEELGVFFGIVFIYNNFFFELNLSWNYIWRRGVEVILKSLRYNDLLENFDFFWNGFDDIVIVEFGEFLKWNLVFREFNLSNNWILDEGIKNIVKGFEGSKKLEVLIFNYNLIFNVC